MGLLTLELRRQIDIALDGIREAESASDTEMRDVVRGRLADLLEIADRHGLTSLTQLIPQQSAEQSLVAVR